MSKLFIITAAPTTTATITCKNLGWETRILLWETYFKWREEAEIG